MHVVQQTLFPPVGFPDRLYLCKRDAKHLHRVDATDNPAPAIAIGPGEILSTDTYFGSFYLAYWRAYTTLGALSLAVAFTGKAQLRVFEDTGRGLVILTSQMIESRGEEPVSIDIETTPERAVFAAPNQPRRLFVELEGVSDCKICAIDFVTDKPPQETASLSIGLCTFNQEGLFARTLGRVTDLLARSDALKRVYVVNQGHPFQSAEIHRLLRRDGVRLIEQRNLGGCGGFTRSLLEAQRENDPASHHLLMDDDIVLDERLIERALTFLSYARDPMALGGGMFDAMRPTIMHEAGAFVNKDNTLKPYCHNVDLSDAGQLHHFNKPVRTDYNAWWFCILPLAETRKLGLPPPVFIRGDDFEYGQRLARAGVPTVTLPGIAVWHEPFYAKPEGWQAYYDLRNRLIFGAAYPEKVVPLSVGRMLKTLVMPILTHQNMIADLRIQATRDFLDGPSRLFARDAADTHAAITARVREFAPEKLDNATWGAVPVAAHLPPPNRLWHFPGLIARGVQTFLFGRFRQRPKVLLDAAAHPRNTINQTYVLTNGPRSFHMMIRPRPSLAFRQLREALGILLRYRRALQTASRTWLDEIDIYRGHDFWMGVFELKGER